MDEGGHAEKKYTHDMSLGGAYKHGRNLDNNGDERRGRRQRPQTQSCDTGRRYEDRKADQATQIRKHAVQERQMQACQVAGLRSCFSGWLDGLAQCRKINTTKCNFVHTNTRCVGICMSSCMGLSVFVCKVSICMYLCVHVHICTYMCIY